MARKLLDRRDIANDIVNEITPLYFPNNTLDKSRTSIYGWLTEVLAKANEDTVMLEQRRSQDYCPELSNSEIRVRQTAQIREVGISLPTPSKAYAILGILKHDILTKGEQLTNEIKFVIDRRSTIFHGTIPFSLEDDIIIRAIQNGTDYIYAASYSGEYATYESYLQMFEQIDTSGQELITIIVQIYQFSYNIQEQVVTDDVKFLYDGIDYFYDNLMAGYEVYYKRTANEEFTRLDTTSYLTTASTSSLYVNTDETGVFTLLDNPALNIVINSTLRAEIKETLGVDGMITIGDSNTTFSLYRDGQYAYAGVNIYINMLSDSVSADNGDDLSTLKAKLIDAKTRRDNITTEHDIISYINDVDANVQIIKKRNDIEDRRYYLYTLLRNGDVIVPANTHRTNLTGVISDTDWGDFDYYDVVTERKVVRSKSKFVLGDDDIVYKTDPTLPEEEGKFYFTSPYMMLINEQNIMSYYFTSVNEEVPIKINYSLNTFPYQMISRGVSIVRNDHAAIDSDKYSITVTGTLNTSTDSNIVDDTGNIIDNNKIICHIVFRNGGSEAAYLPMAISAYDPDTRTFTFTGKLTTNDFITELDRLYITEGLLRVGSTNNYDSVIDYKDGLFDIYFMYHLGSETIPYVTSDNVYTLLPPDYTTNYALMCKYNNTVGNTYTLVLEYNKFTSSPTTILPPAVDTDPYVYSIGEVPLLEYHYGTDNIPELYDSFKNMVTVYSTLLTLTTDFDISLKFIATYGRSKYITVTGGRDVDGNEIVLDLANLNPTLTFKVYGLNINITEIYDMIYTYLRDTYITGNVIFISNICTLVEQSFTSVRSIKYMGVDNLDASYQEFTYTQPVFNSVDVITKFIPEQLNVSDIKVILDEN